MRIVQLIDTLNAGGAERLAVNYANMLCEEFGQSFLVTSWTSGVLEAELNENVAYINLNKKSTFDFSAVKRLKEYLKKNDIEIIHAHTTSYFFAVLTKILYPKIKVVWHDHQGNRDEINVLKQIPLIFSSFFFNGVVVVNSRLGSWVKKYLYTKKVIYVENFISEKIDLNGSTVLFGDNGKRIVKVANLKHPKNHLYLLKAFNKVHERHPNWSLHLVGKNYKDVYSNELFQFIDLNNLTKSVFIYGLKKDINTILKQCTIGVIASSFEGLPMALLEYGNAGLAAISTDVGSCKDLVENRGVVVDSNNQEQLVNGLNLLIENESFRQNSAQEIKKYIEANFTKSIVLEKIKKFYKIL